MKRQQGMMSNEVFERICQQIEKYRIEGVRFIRWGEPTIHPNFMEYIIKMKQINGLLVHFNTNGLNFTSDMLKKIVDIGVDSIKFSFQGIDEISYSEMRSGGKLETVVANIKELYYLRGDKEKPYISVSTTTTYESKEEIAEFERILFPYCDEINVGKTKMDFVDLNRMSLSVERQKIYKKYMESKMQMVRLKVCPEVYDKLSINWDGTVSACCRDYDNQMLVGDIMKEDISDIYYSEQEEIYRKNIADENYMNLPLCINCYEYIPLKK